MENQYKFEAYVINTNQVFEPKPPPPPYPLEYPPPPAVFASGHARAMWPGLPQR
jgi:hypothetical protein